MAKKLTLMAACRDFFGMLPNQTALQFGAEYKKLTEDDKKQIRAELEEKHDYQIIDAAGVSAK